MSDANDAAGKTVNPILAPLHKALGGNLPPALLAEPWELMPLALGVHEALAALLVEHGLSAPEAELLTRRTLVRWTRTTTYQHALAVDGAWRYDLEGNRVEPVAKEHTLATSMGLLTSALRDHAKRTGIPSAPPKPPAGKAATEAAPTKPAEVAPKPAAAPTAPKPAPTQPTITIKKPRTP